MSYSINCYIPLLFLSSGVLCELTMVPDKYILQLPRKTRCTPEGTDAHIWHHIHREDLNHCPSLYYYA